MKPDERGRLWLDPPAAIEWEGRPLKITYRPGLDFCVMEPSLRFYEVTGDTRMLQVARGRAEGRLEDEWTVTYSLVDFGQQMRRGGTDYALSWKGHSVTDISPKGKVWPLFEKVPFPTPPLAADSPGKP